MTRYLARVLRGTLLVALAACTVIPAARAESSMQVIANPSVGISELPLASLRAIFSMRVRRWPDDKQVTVFVLPDRNNQHVAFTKEVLYVYPYVLRDAWDRMVFTGTGQAPIEVRNENDLLERVATTPGAIGYMPKGKVGNAKIKILEVR